MAYRHLALAGPLDYVQSEVDAYVRQLTDQAVDQLKTRMPEIMDAAKPGMKKMASEAFDEIGSSASVQKALGTTKLQLAGALVATAVLSAGLTWLLLDKG